MAINFPDSPSNGDTHTANGIQYTYNSTATTWTDISGNVMFVADTSPTNPNSGDLWWNSSDLKLYVYYNDGTTSQWVANPFGPTGATGPTGTTGAAGTSQTPTLLVADMAALVAVTGMAAGDKALVTGLNKLFMYTGSAWYLIATMTNSSPTAITGANATYTLASDGTATTITLVSTDPEGGPLTWAQTVSVGNLNGTTISNVDNVFTVTPHASNATTFSLQFSATDMVSGIATVVSAFTLTFATDIEIAAFTTNGNTISASTTGAISVTMTNNSNGGPGTMPLHDAPLKLGKRYVEIKILSLTVPNGLYYDFGFVNHAQAVAGTLGSMGGSVSGFAALAAWWGGSSMYGTNQNAGWAVAAGLTVPNTAAGWVNATWMFAYDTTAKKGWIGINGNWETGNTSYLGGDPTGSGVGSDLSSLASGNFGIVMGNGNGSNTSTSVTAQWMTGPSGGTPTYSPPTGFLHYN